MYKVSIVIPTYNVADFIEDTIESVINQTIGFENIELFLVDDQSSDNTQEILNKYSEKYDNIKYIPLKEHQGTPSKGRNIGIETANSNYIMFLDADDLYDENICKEFYESIEKYSADVIICRYVSCTNEENLKLYDDLIDKSKIIIDDPKENLTFFKDIYVWNKMYKVDFLRKFKINFPEDAISEDLFFNIKVNLNTDKVVLLNDYYGYYHNIRDAENPSTTFSISYESFLKILNGFEYSFELLNEYEDSDVLNDAKSEFYGMLIRSFIIVDCSYDKKIELLEKLYNFEKEYGVVKLNVGWENFFYQCILNKRFKLVIYLSKIVSSIENSAYARKLYRKYFRKIK